jgi:hypothetical protein
MEEGLRKTNVHTLTLQYPHRYLQIMKDVIQDRESDVIMNRISSTCSSKNILKNQIMSMHICKHVMNLKNS